MDIKEAAVQKHREWRGKIEIISRAPITNQEELSLAYTPGVAQPCLEIQQNPALSYELTRRGNLVAVITDGTAVLGLGDIGPEAAMPVMEGKCALFKEFGGVDAFPLCIDSTDIDTFVQTVEHIALSFGGINLEDISAPRCFEIEQRLRKSLPIPVFHDDQHGTAIVVGAALINALKLAEKQVKDVTVVINGAGAAGIAICKLLLSLGVGNIILCDKNGILSRGGEFLNETHQKMAEITNRNNLVGGLPDAMKGADVFIGVSRPGVVTRDMVCSMGEKPIVFAMANPTPEIMPEEAKAAGAFVVGTGRSDFPNQINNVLAFPGIFKGVLSVRAKEITEEMKLAAAYGIASIVEDELCPERILPDPFDKRVAEAVAKAVVQVANGSYNTSFMECEKQSSEVKNIAKSTNKTDVNQERRTQKMTMDYKTHGTCSRNIHLVVESGIIQEVTFEGGCNGNLQGISRLVIGKKADEVAELLRGVNCNGKGTSCPDQLAKALTEALATVHA